jgi:hypothetical protein
MKKILIGVAVFTVALGTVAFRPDSEMYGAARWGWKEVVPFLAANNAEVHAYHVRGLMPLDMALGKGPQGCTKRFDGESGDCRGAGEAHAGASDVSRPVIEFDARAQRSSAAPRRPRLGSW